MLEARAERQTDEVELQRSSTARRCSRCRRPSSASTSPSRSAATWSTSSPRRGEPPGRRRREPPRLARAPEARRARAALSGRDFVTPEDVKGVAVPALAHRLMLKPELWVQRIRGEDVVREVLETVPTPPAEDVPRPRADAGQTVVTRRGSPRLGAYAGLSAFGLVTSLVLGLPELVVLVAPFALLLGVGLAGARRPPSSCTGASSGSGRSRARR